MSSKEKKQKRKVAWSEEDEVLRQALIDNAEAYAKAQEKVLSIPGTSVIEDIQYAMSLLYEQYKAEKWPDMFKAKYDLSRAESPIKEALVAARFLEEHTNITTVLYQQHNYDYYWILDESSRILSNAIGEEYDDDFQENDNPEESEDERVDGKMYKQDFQDYGINGEDFVECEENRSDRSALTEESTNQKKRTREDSNESYEASLVSTSTSGKKAKKTKKAVDRDQSPTLQRLIKELTTTDPEEEEILQTEPASESNDDSNIFLNLYNKIVAGEDQLKKTTQDVLHHYFDFGDAMKKRYDHYRSLKHEDLASQSLVEDDVQKQLPNVSEEALRKRIERAQKVYGLFSSINVDINMGRAMIGRIKTFSLSTITALSKEDIKYVIVKVLRG